MIDMSNIQTNKFEMVKSIVDMNDFKSTLKLIFKKQMQHKGLDFKIKFGQDLHHLNFILDLRRL